MKLFLGEKVDQQNIQSTKSFLEIIIEYISRFKDYFDLIKFVFVGILFLITISIKTLIYQIIAISGDPNT